MISSQDPEPNVIPLGAFEPDGKENRRVFKFWSGLTRSVGRAPSYADCDLLEIADTLPSCALLELRGPHEYIVRLFGTLLVDRFGIDLTGVNAYEVFDPADQAGAADRIRILREGPAIIRSKNGLRTAKDVPIVAEWLFLPLESSRGVIDHAIISISILETATALQEIAMYGTLRNRRVLEISLAMLGNC